MNSVAEQAIIGPMAAQANLPMVFWNEPSQRRPEGQVYDKLHPYLGWLNSLEAAVLDLSAAHGPINLIAHSFAGGPALELARKLPDSVRSLTLIATAFDPWAASLKIMKLAADDFHFAGDLDSARRLLAFRDSTKMLGDEPMVVGLLEALKDPLLFNHYYFDLHRKDEVLSELSGAGDSAAADLDSFTGIFRDMRGLGMSRYEGMPIGLPILRLIGEFEKIIDLDVEALLHDRYLTEISTQVVPRAGHFLHIDRTDAFLESVATFLSRISERDSASNLSSNSSIRSTRGASPSLR
jgi:pimeloyl-ACP methyl ester carboxylesterase